MSWMTRNQYESLQPESRYIIRPPNALMIRMCEGNEERWTQAVRSAIVKSERVNHGEENESNDESGMRRTG